MNNTYKPLYNARVLLGLTTAEAGQYVYVSRKTWEHWEKLEEENLAPPKAKTELFFNKIESLGDGGGALVVVQGKDSRCGQSPIDVVGEHNYLGLDDKGDTAIIKSMALDKFTGKPYVHRVEFEKEGNQHVIEFCDRFKPVHE